jgi:hypothetical protein
LRARLLPRKAELPQTGLGGVEPEPDRWTLYQRGDVEFFDKQRDILNGFQAHRRIILPGGRRSSKTFLASCQTAYSMQVGPRRGHLVVAQRIDTTKRLLEELTELLHLLDIRFRYVEHPYPRITLPNGSWVEGRSTDQKRAALQLRGMGKLIHGVVADEAGYLPDWAWAAILPLLADNDAWLFEIGTTNGRNRFYEHHQWGLDPDRPKWGAFHLHTRDNIFLPPAAYDELVASLTPEEIATEIEARFTRRRGAVFPDFDEALHLRRLEDDRRVVKRLAGIDWGSTNPAVVLPMLIDADDVAWTPDEWYRRETTLEQHRAAALRMKKRWGIKLFLADPSEPQMIKFFRAGGVPIRAAGKDDTAVLAGVNSLRRRLGNYSYEDSRGRVIERPATWFIDPECCPNLVSELVNYHYAEGTANRDPGDVPVKQGDHAIDAARYVLHRHDRRAKGVLPKARSVNTSRL